MGSCLRGDTQIFTENNEPRNYSARQRIYTNIAIPFKCVDCSSIFRLFFPDIAIALIVHRSEWFSARVTARCAHQ